MFWHQYFISVISGFSDPRALFYPAYFGQYTLKFIYDGRWLLRSINNAMNVKQGMSPQMRNLFYKHKIMSYYDSIGAGHELQRFKYDHMQDVF